MSLEFSPTTTSTPIFRGPGAYPQDAAAQFFGRDSEVRQGYEGLIEYPFYIIEGESGCGKSSLIRAGLLPKLEEKFQVDLRRFDTKRPFPFPNLEKPLLIIYDQFEDIFRKLTDKERLTLIKTMLSRLEEKKCRFCISLRQDYFAHLIRLCKSVDPDRKYLTTENFLTIAAFSKERTEEVLQKMLIQGTNSPLSAEQKQFCSSLATDLLRPPRDPELKNDTKTVLPVELQTIGMLLERRGQLNVQTIKNIGGKTGLLQAFVEDATTYAGKQAIIDNKSASKILDTLIPKKITITDIHAQHKEFSKEQIQRVIEAFIEKYVIREIPNESASNNEPYYEFLHEHLIFSLNETSLLELIRRRDKQERMQFWTDRAKPVFAPLPKTAKFPERLRHIFATPIPLWEATSLWYGASVEDKKTLRQNQLGWFKRYSTGALALGIPIGIFFSYTNTWSYQMSYIIRDAISVPLNSSVRDFNQLYGEYFKLLMWMDYSTQPLKTAVMLTDNHSRCIALTNIFDAYTDMERRENAILVTQTLDQAIASALLIKDQNRTYALTFLADELSRTKTQQNILKANELCHAALTASKEIKTGSFSNTYRSDVQKNVISIFIRIKELDEALNVAEMLQNDDMTDGLSRVAEAFAATGEPSHFHKATEILQKARISAERIEDGGYGAHATALTRVAEAYVKIGKIDIALNIVENIKDDKRGSHSRVIAMAQVAEAIIKTKYSDNASKAKYLITKSIQDIESTKNSDPSSYSDGLSRLAEVISKSYRLSQDFDAESMLKKAHTTAQTIKDNGFGENRAPITRIAHAFITINKPKTALDIVNGVDENFMDRDNVLLRITETFTLAGNPEKALEVAMSIENNSSRSEALVRIVDALVKTRHTKKLIELRTLALSQAKGSGDTIAQWSAFASKCSTLLGQEKQAQEEATGIKDISYRLDAYNFLMREHLKRTNPKFREVWEAEQKEIEDNKN